MAATETQASASDIFRILVATDTHIGYKEKDFIRADDSFIVFEEILQMALTMEVDFVLHAGDLFDLHKPSRSTLYRTMGLLRNSCFSSFSPSCSSSSSFSSSHSTPTFCVNNQSTRSNVFKFNKANFEFGYPSIRLPIFCIHGNHDDPGEESFLSPIDILESANMLTYFGWVENLDDVQLHPILLQKGESKIALYGLGNIRDERLHRALQTGKVHFHQPEFGPSEDYFYILALHQNRYKGAFGGVPNKNCIQDQMLPKHLDLVIWGHEHDCILSAAESEQSDFHIIQPGSSVATSLSPGEAEPKHVVLLEVRRDTFRSSFVPLRNVRPLLCRELILSESGCIPQSDAMIEEMLRKEVEGLIKQAKQNWATHISEWGDQLKSKIYPAFGFSMDYAESFISWAEQNGLKMTSSHSSSSLQQQQQQQQQSSSSSSGNNTRSNSNNFVYQSTNNQQQQQQQQQPQQIRNSSRNQKVPAAKQRQKKNLAGGNQSSQENTAEAVEESEESILPCLRLKVENSGFNEISTQRFGSQFVGRVANPNEILMFYKRRKAAASDSSSAASGGSSTRPVPELEIEDSVDSKGFGVQDLIFKYLSNESALEILAEPDLNIAVQDFVHKLETSAIDRFVNKAVLEAQTEVKNSDKAFQQPEDIRSAVHSRTQQLRTQREAAFGDAAAAACEFTVKPDTEEEEKDDDDEEASAAAAAVGIEGLRSVTGSFSGEPATPAAPGAASRRGTAVSRIGGRGTRGGRGGRLGTAEASGTIGTAGATRTAGTAGNSQRGKRSRSVLSESTDQPAAAASAAAKIMTAKTPASIIHSSSSSSSAAAVADDDGPAAADVVSSLSLPQSKKRKESKIDFCYSYRCDSDVDDEDCDGDYYDNNKTNRNSAAATATAELFSNSTNRAMTEFDVNFSATETLNDREAQKDEESKSAAAGPGGSPVNRSRIKRQANDDTNSMTRHRSSSSSNNKIYYSTANTASTNTNTSTIKSAAAATSQMFFSKNNKIDLRNILISDDDDDDDENFAGGREKTTFVSNNDEKNDVDDDDDNNGDDDDDNDGGLNRQQLGATKLSCNLTSLSSRPTTTKSTTTKSITTKSTTSKSATAKSATTKSATAKSATTKAGPTKSAIESGAAGATKTSSISSLLSQLKQKKAQTTLELTRSDSLTYQFSSAPNTTKKSHRTSLADHLLDVEDSDDDVDDESSSHLPMTDRAVPLFNQQFPHTSAIQAQQQRQSERLKNVLDDKTDDEDEEDPIEDSLELFCKKQ